MVRLLQKGGAHMKKWLIRILIGILALLIVAFAGFVIWAQLDYDATEEGLSYKPEGREVMWGDGTEEIGFVFYQGAKVRPDAYSYIGDQLAADGHFVAIPQLPFNIALLDSNRAFEYMEDYPEIDTWYLMGHSLGGAAASTIVEENEKIAGIIFLASYPVDSIDVPSLTIYGGQDGLLSAEDIESSRENLRSDAVFHKIEEGNHANFGMYGEQAGDNPSPLSPKEQLDETVMSIKEFIQ